jgi:hypothetical protein
VPFAVYFSTAESAGRIALTATATTEFHYIAFRSPWTCFQYYLSTSPFETWSATSTGGNFTLENSTQSVYIFHVSDVWTSLSLDCQTSENGRLDYLLSDATNKDWTRT